MLFEKAVKVGQVPEEALGVEFCFVGKTDGELSLVCGTTRRPPVNP